MIRNLPSLMASVAVLSICPVSAAFAQVVGAEHDAETQVEIAKLRERVAELERKL